MKNNQVCVHSDKCKYTGCPYHHSFKDDGKSNTFYIGIGSYEEMKNCTVYLDR